MAVEVVRGAEVWCPDGFAGTVGHLSRDGETGALLGFVLHLGMEGRADVFVPVDWVARADARRVTLLVSLAEVLGQANPRDEDSLP